MNDTHSINLPPHGATPDGGPSPAMLKAIFDNASIGVVVCDLAGRLTAVNCAFTRLLGLSHDQMLGRRLTEFCLGEDGSGLACWLAQVENGAAADAVEAYETRFAHTNDGVVGRALLRPSIWRDAAGRPAAIFAMVEDVTADRLREAALKRSEARLRAIVDGAVDAIVSCDTAGRILTANPATNRLFGYPADHSFIGQPVTVLMALGDAAHHGSYMQRYLVTGERRKLGIGRELMGRKSDGTDLPVWISLSEINLPDFHVFVAMLHDMSAVKAAELALIEARDAALLANRAKTSFLSNISHELRTPLNGIIGFADVILGQMMGEIGNASYLNYAAEIKRSGELLLTNITDILEIASIEAGSSRMEETLVDFREMAVAAIRLISKRAQEARLSIEVDLRTEIPPLRADPGALKQVLLHLLSNAVKFTGEGGVIGISAHLDPDGGGLVVEVSDTGVGIPADRMEAIFQPFVQGHDSLSRPHEGVGLGLTLARALVERHGGRVEIDSRESVGTRVALFLPPERFYNSAGR